MIAVETGPDVVVSTVAATLSKGRVASAVLRDVVIPAMPPARRTFPQSLVRRIERGDTLSEEIVAEIDVFIEMLGRRIDDATAVGW